MEFFYSHSNNICSTPPSKVSYLNYDVESYTHSLPSASPEPIISLPRRMEERDLDSVKRRLNFDDYADDVDDAATTPSPPPAVVSDDEDDYEDDDDPLASLYAHCCSTPPPNDFLPNPKKRTMEEIEPIQILMEYQMPRKRIKLSAPVVVSEDEEEDTGNAAADPVHGTASSSRDRSIVRKRKLQQVGHMDDVEYEMPLCKRTKTKWAKMNPIKKRKYCLTVSKDDGDNDADECSTKMPRKRSRIDMTSMTRVWDGGCCTVLRIPKQQKENYEHPEFLLFSR